jgi:thiol-disulfide isomerase/thioredoxin
MKKTFAYRSLVALSMISLMILASCDKISHPFVEGKPNDTTTTLKPRKVLLEDFTGHRCPNCPEGHAVVKDLEQLYGEQLIAISIHAGVFALVVPPVYTYNFSTPTGEALNTAFGVSTYPSGMVNRKKVTGNYVLGKDSWGTEVAGLITQAADAWIVLTPTWNSTSRSLDVKVDSEFLNSLTGTYRLCVYLTEDSIVKPQKDNLSTPSDVMNYNHMHVLRGAVNSTWGDTLAVDPTAGQIFTKTYTGFNVNAGWDESNCKVVAFIYRDDDADGTRYEVVQAERKKIK